MHITVPLGEQTRALVAELLGVPGVVVSSGITEQQPHSKEHLTLGEGAKLINVNYYTFREWVVVRKLIPSERPSGAVQGSIRVKRADVLGLMQKDCTSAKQPTRKTRKPGRPAREVKVI